MFVFIVANLPLPVIAFLNWQVTLKYLRVRKLAKEKPIAKPRQLLTGWWIANLALPFIAVPPLVEGRFFVENRWWLISYAIAAALTIGGLILMNDALGDQIRKLEQRRRRSRFSTRVDR